MEVLHSICQQIWKTQQWPQDWKRTVFIPMPKKGNAKECSNYHTIALISHSSKVMLTILQARLQQNVNFQMFKLVLEKAEEPDIKLPTSPGSWKRQEKQKNIYFCFIDYAKAEIDVFLELSCFFHDPMDVGNLISGSSAFSKTSLNIWRFTVHILLKPGLKNFEHYFASM